MVASQQPGISAPLSLLINLSIGTQIQLLAPQQLQTVLICLMQHPVLLYSCSDRKFSIVIYWIDECTKGSTRHVRSSRDVKEVYKVLSMVNADLPSVIVFVWVSTTHPSQGLYKLDSCAVSKFQVFSGREVTYVTQSM